MDPTHETLQQALSLAALVAGTLQYAIVLRRRADRRAEERYSREVQELGLRGLVRVLLVEDPMPARH
jgi:hypothetical protein